MVSFSEKEAVLMRAGKRKALISQGLTFGIAQAWIVLWCRRSESNRHGLPRWILSPVRLPVSPLRQELKNSSYIFKMSFSQETLGSTILFVSSGIGSPFQLTWGHLSQADIRKRDVVLF
jgi:hypothetical protein